MSRKMISPQKREELAELKRVTEAMSPALRKAGDRAKQLIERSLSHALAASWEVGKIFTTACEHEQDPDEARHALILYTDLSPRYMDQWTCFYRAFSDEADRDRLFSARMKMRNTPLTWPYIQKLITISDKAEIMKLIDQVCENDWSVDELQAAIDRLFNKAVGQRHAGGRPVSVPPTLSGKIANLQKIVGFIPRNAHIIYQHPQNGILKTLSELPADRITPELVESLDAALNSLVEAGETIQNLQGDLQRGLAIAQERAGRHTQAMAEREADDIDGKKKRK